MALPGQQQKGSVLEYSAGVLHIGNPYHRRAPFPLLVAIDFLPRRPRMRPLPFPSLVALGQAYSSPQTGLSFSPPTRRIYKKAPFKHLTPVPRLFHGRHSTEVASMQYPCRRGAALASKSTSSDATTSPGRTTAVDGPKNRPNPAHCAMLRIE